MTDPIHTERVDGTFLVAVENPPVNAASQPVRAGLVAALQAAAAEDGCDVIALYGMGRTFTAGADIREFGKPPLAPILPDVCLALERSAKPVVVVLHGTALGGGLEMAMSAQVRVALPGARVGLPEVTLGILPGAGGTQRLPRLAGIPAALDMILSGKPVDAERARELGIVDRIMEGAPRDVALAAAALLRDGTLAPRRTPELTVAPADDALAAATETVRRTQPHLFSPLRCIEAVAASTGPLDDGLALERRLFQDCIESPQRAGLIHAFFAERAVQKIPEQGATPREIASIGVIGGGTMGSGIATAALLAGLRVTLVEQRQDALDRGRATVEKNLAQAVRRGKLSEADRASLLSGAFATSLEMDRLAGVDLVVEAVFEDMGVKREVFGALDAICRPGAILATNTSYLDIDAIAAATSRPADVVGLHFFSPAHVMRLLEVVVARDTAPEVVATGFALARRMGKVAVRAGVCDGFIGNRILAHYKKVADHMMLDGADPAQIDAALTGFGFAMGPFAVSDLAGLDIGWATRKRQAASRPDTERYVAVADRICEAGWFGRKSGRGFYDYPEGGAPVPNPEVEGIIAAERERAGVTPRDFTDEEIVARFTTAMIAEAARVLEDGIALRPIDIDAVFLFGYGFPRFRGGPMHHADTVGAAELVVRIERYGAEDPHYWRVPELLRRMAGDGSRFADLNERA